MNKIITGLATFFIVAYVLMLIWNHAICTLINVGELTYLQSIGIYMLLNLIGSCFKKD